MKGIPLATATALAMYEGKGRKSVRFGFDVKEVAPDETPADVKIRNERNGIEIVDYALLPQRKLTGAGMKRIANVEVFDKEKVYGMKILDSDCVFGSSYAGIPAAVALLYGSKFIARDIRFAYDRMSEKTHGVSSEKLLVGDIRDNDKILIVDMAMKPENGFYGDLRADDKVLRIDDVVTSGKTDRQGQEKLDSVQSDINHVGLLVGVDRRETGTGGGIRETLNRMGQQLYSVVDVLDVFLIARENGWCTKQDLENFQAYRRQYGI
jgi:orotate phosphoribosyltransferase